MFSTKELEGFVCKSNSAVELKFVRKEADVFDDSLSFSPLYTHQVFGENEAIFGYKDLKIKLYYTPDDLHTYIGIQYTETVDRAKHDGITPDNIINSLAQYIPEGFSTNQDEFMTHLSSHTPSEFRPHGAIVHVYTQPDTGRVFQIHKVDISCPGFKEYHSRLQPFLLWFIESGSFIDIDDEKWSFYLIFEKLTDNGNTMFAIAGYTTVYGFYAYPDKIRPRISQMLILPPYQRQGHGAHLLQAIYDDLVPNPQVLDITVEDPSDEFRALRDYVDSSNALKFDCFRPPQVHAEFSKSMEDKCRELKLQKWQGRRVYEILRLRSTDRSDPDQYLKFRLMVKNRLNGPFKREQRDLQKLHQVMDPVEIALTHPPVSHDDHVIQLHQAYKELEEEYMRVIEKLAKTPNVM